VRAIGLGRSIYPAAFLQIQWQYWHYLVNPAIFVNHSLKVPFFMFGQGGGQKKRAVKTAPCVPDGNRQQMGGIVRTQSRTADVPDTGHSPNL